MLFFYVFAAVLADVRAAASEAGLITSLPWSDDMRDNPVPVPCAAEGAVPLHDVSWMDDCRSCWLFRPPLLHYGLTPNLDRGKTEAIVSLKGPGAGRIRAECLSGIAPSVPCFSQHWPNASLNIVPAYKHLGGILHHKGGLGPEIRVRVGQSWRAFRKHWPRLFGQSQIPLRDKFPLFQSLVLSTLFYGAGTWPRLRDREFAPLNRCYVEMCRSLLRKHFKGDAFHLSDDRVLALVQAPCVADWLHFHRLTYWASFVRLEVKEAWALVHQEQHWLRSVRDSLSWLQAQAAGAAAREHWSVSWPGWRDSMKGKPRVWKRLLRSAVQRSLRKAILAEGWQQCRGTLAKCLLNAGAVLQTRVDCDAVASFFCGPCRRRFRTRQQWALHAFKVHGRVRPVRRLAPGEQCPACLRSYASNTAMCAHLAYSHRCRLELVSRGFSCDPEPGLGSKLHRSGADTQSR